MSPLIKAAEISDLCCTLTPCNILDGEKNWKVRRDREISAAVCREATLVLLVKAFRENESGSPEVAGLESRRLEAYIWLSQ
jgi:hypothetical protein